MPLPDRGGSCESTVTLLLEKWFALANVLSVEGFFDFELRELGR